MLKFLDQMCLLRACDKYTKFLKVCFAQRKRAVPFQAKLACDQSIPICCVVQHIFTKRLPLILCLLYLGKTALSKISALRRARAGISKLIVLSSAFVHLYIHRWYDTLPQVLVIYMYMPLDTCTTCDVAVVHMTFDDVMTTFAM